MIRRALPSLLLLVACKPAPPFGPTASQVAAQMDQRVPVPLLPMMAQHQKENMRGHLAALQELTASLARDDFDGVAAASRKLGTSPEMERMCSHMGAGAPGFTPTALAFHRSADAITAAAERRDRAAVLAAMNDTLTRCVGCHATYKQEIVDEPTWARLTAPAAPAR